jgi:RNA-directed DNA polymerase
MPSGAPGSDGAPGGSSRDRRYARPYSIASRLLPPSVAGILIKLSFGGWGEWVAVLGFLLLCGWIVWLFRPWRFHRALRRFDPGLGPGALADVLGVPEKTLREFRTAYRVVRIPKKHGGLRTLHVPDDATKDLQRRILRLLLTRMKTDVAACGFEPGRSIVDNAMPHVGRALVLRYDVVDFFTATRASRVERMFLRFGWNAEAAALITRLVTHEGGLPQGAPTSPRLSNILNARLDRELRFYISRKQGQYTRYADDITVSFPEDWIGQAERTRAIVARSFALRGYRLHGKEKTSVRRRHQRQVVTGLVVNRKVALPRTIRRRLRAARHNAARGRPVTFTPDQLQGWASFEEMVRTQSEETWEPWVRYHAPGNPGRARP